MVDVDYDQDLLPDCFFGPIELLVDKRLSLKRLRILIAIFSFRKPNTNLDFITPEIISEMTGYSLDKVLEENKKLKQLGWTDDTCNIVIDEGDY